MGAGANAVGWAGFASKCSTSMSTACIRRAGLITQFPSKYIGSWEWSESEKIPPMFDDRVMVADVTVTTEYPVYPAREKVKTDSEIAPVGRGGRERVIFPCGTFRTALCGDELLDAMLNRAVRKWHRVQYYVPAPLMRAWAHWALAMRASLEDLDFGRLKNCAKKIINLLPGKVGSADENVG